MLFWFFLPVDKPLLNVLQKLGNRFFKRFEMSGTVSEMVTEDLRPEDGGQLAQSF